MVFEGVRGNGYAGDIAIDDVEFNNFACTNLPTKSVPAGPTTKAPTTVVSTLPPTAGKHIISKRLYNLFPNMDL